MSAAILVFPFVIHWVCRMILKRYEKELIQRREMYQQWYELLRCEVYSLRREITSDMMQGYHKSKYAYKKLYLRHLHVQRFVAPKSVPNVAGIFSIKKTSS